MSTHTSTRLAASAALAGLLLLALVAAPAAQLANPGFETGDLTGWIADDMADPLTPLQVVGSGWGDPRMPTEGDWCVINGFDGGGPGSIVLAQDVSIPKSASTLLFDYAANWDMIGYGGGLDRSFKLFIEEAGGGALLRELAVRTARWNTAETTGVVSAAADVSGLRGETVRVKFVWWVPESYTGPASAQLDNLRLLGKRCDPVDRGSLKIHICFDQLERDAVKLQLVVPVQPGFVPTGHTLSVRVGDLLREVVLDAKGRGSAGDVKLRVRPEPSRPGYQRVRAVIKQGNYLAALQPYGLGNLTTAKGGETRDVPVRIELDGLETQAVECVLYKARMFGSGSAKAVHVPESMPTRAAVRLDFDDTDRDRLLLRGMARTHAGFLPEGRTLQVSLGGVERSFVLDADGRGKTATDTIKLRRDKRAYTQQSLVWSCKHANLSKPLSLDGFVDASVPKPGQALQPEILLTVDELTCQPLIDLVWLAKAGRWGKAKGKL